MLPEILYKIRLLYGDDLGVLVRLSSFLILFTVIDVAFIATIGFLIEKALVNYSDVLYMGLSAVSLLALAGVVRFIVGSIGLLLQRSIFRLSIQSVSKAKIEDSVFGNNRNSELSAIRKLLLIEPAFFTNRGVRPVVNLTVESVVILVSLIYFSFVSPLGTVIVIGISMSVIILFSKIVRKWIKRIVLNREAVELERQHYVNAIVDMRVRAFTLTTKLKDRVILRLTKVFDEFAKVSADMITISGVPKIVMEFVGISVVVIGLYFVTEGSGSELEGFGATAIILLRILSGSGRVITAVQNLKFGYGSLRVLVNDK